MRMPSALIFLFWFVLSFPVVTQAQEEAQEILQTALSYPALSPCWCEDSSGQPIISGLATQNRVSALPEISFTGTEVPLATAFPGGQAHVIELKRLSMNADRSRAKVKIRYHNRVRATFRLHWINGLWRVKGALIRQKKPCEGRGGGKRFVWNF